MPEVNQSAPSQNQNAGLSDNAAGAIAYITIVPAVIFLLVDPYRRNSLVRFHSWQSIALFISVCVINVALAVVVGITIAFVPFLSVALMPLVYLFWLIVWLLCIINAAQGKKFKLPLIGAFCEQLADRQ